MFYDTVQDLCKENKTTITRMAKDIGLSNAAAASWRKGSIPKLGTVRKIADYFGVSMESLLEQNTPMSISGARNSTILQGNIGHTIAAGDVHSEAPRLTDQEEEVLRLFRSFDMRKKTAVLSYLYNMEDGEKREV